jgi:hypothetical protein
MVSPRGILMDNLINFILDSLVLDGGSKLAHSTRKMQVNAPYIYFTQFTFIMQTGPDGYGDENDGGNQPDDERRRWEGTRFRVDFDKSENTGENDDNGQRQRD